jgi:hypothetical protein
VKSPEPGLHVTYANEKGRTMKRRTFLQSSLAAASGFPLTAAAQGTAANSTGDRQFLEWRRYDSRTDAQHALVSNFLQHAVLPALKRLNIGPVGVFSESGQDASKSLYTLVPFDSLEQFVNLGRVLGSDQEFLTAAGDYLSASKESPAYDRIENQLMVAFKGHPQVTIPRSGDRIFELRIYESHSELKAKLKIEMFNDAEFEIFRKVGLDGVFFGETIVGANLPNLTYMLAYSDMAEHDRAWQAFREHPDWIELRDRERYKDTVSKVASRFLNPTEYSQI